jgi:hypothetical protein
MDALNFLENMTPEDLRVFTDGIWSSESVYTEVHEPMI